MTLTTITNKHIPELMTLVQAKLDVAYETYPELPHKLDHELEDKLTWILQEHEGYAILSEEGKIKGFMASIFLEDLFYKEKGVFTPEWAHNLEMCSKSTGLMLLDTLYKRMVEKAYSQHALSLMHYASGPKDYLFDHGYGSRCMDGIRLIESVETVSTGKFQIVEGTIEDLKPVADLLRDHHNHLASYPTYVGFDYGEPRTIIRTWLEDDRVSLWLLKMGELTIGMMKTVDGKGGGSDICWDHETLGIETTQLMPAYRGRGLMKEMIHHANNYAMYKGFKRLAVDWETINPTANDFWPKYFRRTVRSLVRYKVL